jgi:hypothetical protein
MGGTGCVGVEDLEGVQRGALLDLFHATHGSHWTTRTNWGSSLPLADWAGVTVKDGCVVKLKLASNNLRGSLPASLYHLDHLTVLDLRLNQLCGPVPPELGHMHLTHIYLQSNRLSCALPDTLGALTNLTVLDLRSNMLCGALPVKALVCLRKLKYLGLRSNQFKDQFKGGAASGSGGSGGSGGELQPLLPWCKIVL